MAAESPEGGDAGNRRFTRDRRNQRRRHDDPGWPPYLETFDRIAAALENIEQLLRHRPVTLPDASRESRAERR